MRGIIGLLASVLLAAATPATASPYNLANAPTSFLNATLTPPDGNAWSDGVYGPYAELCPDCWWGNTAAGVLLSYGLLASSIEPLGTPGYIGSDYPEVAVWGNVVITPEAGSIGIVSGDGVANPVPEPSTLALVGAGFFLLLGRLTRKPHPLIRPQLI